MESRRSLRLSSVSPKLLRFVPFKNYAIYFYADPPAHRVGVVASRASAIVLREPQPPGFKPERHTGMIDYNSREALKALALKHVSLDLLLSFFVKKKGGNYSSASSATFLYVPTRKKLQKKISHTSSSQKGTYGIKHDILSALYPLFYKGGLFC